MFSVQLSNIIMLIQYFIYKELFNCMYEFNYWCPYHDVKLRNVVRFALLVYWLLLYHLALIGTVVSCSYGSWIYNCQWKQCLSPLTLWVRNPIMARCTRYIYVIKFVSDLWKVIGFLRGLRLPPPNTTDSHDITQILLKVTLNTITLCYCISTLNNK